jgi:hypothetical protein
VRCTENGLGQEIGQGRQGCTALLRYGDLDTSTNCSTPPTPMTRLLRSGTRNRQIDSTRARRARARAAASRRAQLRRLGRGNPTVDNRARAGDNVHPPLPACISSCDARPLLLSPYQGVATWVGSHRCLPAFQGGATILSKRHLAALMLPMIHMFSTPTPVFPLLVTLVPSWRASFA